MGATEAGTKSYFEAYKIQAASASLGKTGFTVSPVGFGGYRIQVGNPEHEEALRLALRSGCNLIDTSANYGDGKSELLIGRVLSSMIRAGKLKREQVVVVTKAGYLQGTNLAIAQERERAGRPFAETVKISRDLWHCISPEFLEDQITRSLERLGLDRLDVLLLHNPEYFLKADPDPEEYYARILRAFRHLEAEVARGRIQHYGVSSNTFPSPSSEKTFTSLSRLLELANGISPENHFSVIQFPMNLLETGAALEKNNQGESVLQLASRSGLGTLVNRPLNAIVGHGLIRLADFIPHPESELGHEFGEALGEAIQLEERCPDPEAIPMERIAWGHIINEHMEELSDLERWRQVLIFQALPSLKAAESEVTGEENQRWLIDHQAACNRLFQAFSAVAENRSAEQSKRLSKLLTELRPELGSTPTLSRKALRIYRSVPGVGCVLLGMRRPQYVRDGLQLDPALPGDVALQVLTRMSQIREL